MEVQQEFQKKSQMVEDFFMKEPLRKIDPDKIVAFGATLAAYLNNLDIKDSTLKILEFQLEQKLILLFLEDNKTLYWK